MLSFRRVAASALALLAVTTSFAASILGSWQGHADFSGVKDPKKAAMMKQMLSTMKFSITFKGDKTYTVKYAGGPSKGGSDSGTWTQAGNVVSVKSKKSTEKMYLSGNGKTLTMSPENSEGMKLIFTH